MNGQAVHARNRANVDPVHAAARWPEVESPGVFQIEIMQENRVGPVQVLECPDVGYTLLFREHNRGVVADDLGHIFRERQGLRKQVPGARIHIEHSKPGLHPVQQAGVRVGRSGHVDAGEVGRVDLPR
ncbi:hypothetical protein D3C85_1028990 [compost metagenome]